MCCDFHFSSLHLSHSLNSSFFSPVKYHQPSRWRPWYAPLMWHPCSPSEIVKRNDWKKERGYLWKVEAAIRQMMTFYLPTQWLLSDTTCGDNPSEATNNVWWRDYVKTQAFRLKATLLFLFSQISSAFDDTVYTGSEGGRRTCRNLHTISLLQCFSKRFLWYTERISQKQSFLCFPTLVLVIFRCACTKLNFKHSALCIELDIK